jgi:hypothetical protein
MQIEYYWLPNMNPTIIVLGIHEAIIPMDVPVIQPVRLIMCVTMI